MFFSSRNNDFPILFAETLGDSLFLPPFFSFFNASSLRELGDFDDKQGEKHSTKISFQMKWTGMAKP
jgi:hypothetical protein